MAETLGSVEVEVRASLAEFEKAIADVKSQVKAIDSTTAEATLGVDASDVEEGAAQAAAELEGIEDEAALGLDSDVEEGAAAADALLDGIEGEAALGLDLGDVEGGAAAADSMLQEIEGMAGLGLDWSEVEGGAAAAESMLQGIEATATLGVDTSEVDGAVASVQAQLDGIEGSASGPGQAFGGGFDQGSAVAMGGISGVKGGIGGLAVAAGAFVGIQTFSGFIGDAREARQIMATLSQEIEVTGASAWTSVESIDAMASSIQSVTGISDEQIKSNATMLLSFKSVQNQMGEGNDIFDRAIKSSADLAQLMGTDMSSATLQLGKALEDPIKGISAMTRSGVTFTDQQKEQIKTLVESGDKLTAQGMIMEAVEGQSMGLAEAAADSGDLMSAAWGDMSQALGEALLPAMDAFAGIAKPVLEFFTNLPGPLQMVLVAIPILGIGLATLGVVLPAIGAGLAAVGIGGGTAAVGTAAAGTASAASSVGFFAAAAGLWAMMAPLLPIVAAIAAVIAIGVLLWKNWDTIKEVAGKVWDWVADKFNWVKERIGAAVGWLVEQFDKFKEALQLIRDKVGEVFDWVQEKIGGAITFIVEKFVSFREKVAEVWDWIKDKASGVIDFFASIPGKIGSAFSSVADAITSPFKAAFNFIKTLWNNTIGRLSFSIPSWVPGIGGKGFSMPQLAKGGTITDPGFVMVGEQGPERLWLGEGATVEPLSRGGSAPGMAYSPSYQVTINGDLDSRQERRLVDLLDSHDRDLVEMIRGGVH